MSCCARCVCVCVCVCGGGGVCVCVVVGCVGGGGGGETRGPDGGALFFLRAHHQPGAGRSSASALLLRACQQPGAARCAARSQLPLRLEPKACPWHAHHAQRVLSGAKPTDLGHSLLVPVHTRTAPQGCSGILRDKAATSATSAAAAARRGTTAIVSSGWCTQNAVHRREVACVARARVCRLCAARVRAPALPARCSPANSRVAAEQAAGAARPAAAGQSGPATRQRLVAGGHNRRATAGDGVLDVGAKQHRVHHILASCSRCDGEVVAPARREHARGHTVGGRGTGFAAHNRRGAGAVPATSHSATACSGAAARAHRALQLTLWCR
jgi:hypothetical protein